MCIRDRIEDGSFGGFDALNDAVMNAIRAWLVECGEDALIGREEDVDTADLENALGMLHNDQGRYEEALEHYGRALAMRRKVLGEEHPDVASSLNNLAGVYISQGRYDEALEHYGRALAMRRKALGEEHPEVATTLNNMAVVYRSCL